MVTCTYSAKISHDRLFLSKLSHKSVSKERISERRIFYETLSYLDIIDSPVQSYPTRDTATKMHQPRACLPHHKYGITVEYSDSFIFWSTSFWRYFEAVSIFLEKETCKNVGISVGPVVVVVVGLS